MTNEGNLRDCGKKLLSLFRQQQLQHGNRGCECVNCQDDMIAAIEKLAEEGIFLTRKNPR